MKGRLLDVEAPLRVLLAASFLFLLLTAPAQANLLPESLPEEGAFVLTEQGLSPTESKDKRGSFWLAEVAQAPGEVLLAEVRGKKALELSVVFHAEARDEGLVGYAIRFKGKRVRLERLDPDEVVPLTDFETLRKAKTKPIKLSIRAAVMGERLVVEIRDVRRKRVLATFITKDQTYRGGQVGLRKARNRRHKGRLFSLSLADACARKGLFKGSLYATFPADDAPHGVSWLEENQEIKVASLSLDQLATLSCRGHIPSALNPETPLKYVDPNFLAAAQSPLPREDDAFIIDRSYKNPTMIHRVLRAFAKRYPERARLIKIGESHQGRAIWAVALSDGGENAWSRPTFLLNGAHHGNEPLSVEFVLDALQVLLERPTPIAEALLANYVVWLVPVVNPDGLWRHTMRARREGRKNGRDEEGDGKLGLREGVDLNRNYPFAWASLGEEGSRSSPNHAWFRGPSAGSEPETQAMMALAEAERFATSVSFHTGNTCVLAPYTIDGVDNPTPNDAWTLGKKVADAMPLHPHGDAFELRKNIYPVDGVDQDWLRYSYGTVALLIEGSGGSPVELPRRQKIVSANREGWLALADAALHHPRISGHVHDLSGHPVQLSVTLLEAPLHAGEVWTTRCRDGRFDRFVSAPGSYTLELRDLEGKALRRVKVEVPKGPVHLDLLVNLPAEEARKCANPARWDPQPHPIDVQRVVGRLLLAQVSAAAHGSLLPAPQVPAPRPTPPEASSEPEEAPSAQASEGGCGCQTRKNQGPGLWWLLMGLGFLWLRLGKRL